MMMMMMVNLDFLIGILISFFLMGDFLPSILSSHIIPSICTIQLAHSANPPSFILSKLGF